MLRLKGGGPQQRGRRFERQPKGTGRFAVLTALPPPNLDQPNVVVDALSEHQITSVAAVRSREIGSALHRAHCGPVFFALSRLLYVAVGALVFKPSPA